MAKDATAARKPKGNGTTISLDFKDHPEVLAHIREQAKNDDREPSKWLRRYVVGKLGLGEAAKK